MTYCAQMFVRPITVTKALAHVKAEHRRLPNLQGGMWAVGLYAEYLIVPELVGVAIVGRPTARLLDNGERLQVLRVAVIEGIKNGCSKLYGVCGASARVMGATDCFTYIHDDEDGTSLKAAGWIEFGESRGGQWSRSSRLRDETVEPGGKRRFFAPWSQMLKTRSVVIGGKLDIEFDA